MQRTPPRGAGSGRTPQRTPSRTPSRGSASDVISNVTITQAERAKELYEGAMGRLDNAGNIKREYKEYLREAITELYYMVEENGKTEPDEEINREDQHIQVTSETKRILSVIPKLENIVREEVQKAKERHDELLEKVQEICKQGRREERVEESEVNRVLNTNNSPTHTILIRSTDRNDTSYDIVNKIRQNVDGRRLAVGVKRLRKAKNATVVLSCDTKDDINKIKEEIGKIKKLKYEDAKMKMPRILLKEVAKFNNTEDIVESIKIQNRGITAGLSDDELVINELYRNRTRNEQEVNIIVELSPILHHRILNEGKIYVGLQRITALDQSPLVQCFKCLKYGHTKKVCKSENTEPVCLHCSNLHIYSECPNKDKRPCCINCLDETSEDLAEHRATSKDCPIRKKWDTIARARVQYYV